VVEGKTEFPDFERLIEKEIPIVYHEEYYHQMRLFIGPFIAVLGILPLFLFRMTWGELQTFGLVATLFGVILTIRSFVLYRSNIREYSYKGLSRKTITEAIMFLDTRFVQPEKKVQVVPFLKKMVLSSYKFGRFKKEFYKFVESTTGLITWPSRLFDGFEMDIQDVKKGFRPISITFLLVLPVISIVTIYLSTFGGWTLLIAIVPSGYCFFWGIFSFFRYLYDNAPLFRSNWINQVLKSESIQLEDTIDAIFNLLQSEFPYPLRFHLTGEYPQLTYTDRTITSHTRVSLKEAVLYPQNEPQTGLHEKEESTGAD
ncbi:MAG: hypothetical protein ACXAB0_00540, partial [Candidatus Thorarchaeota archaeon]|jgi:hypothetical protein